MTGAGRSLPARSPKQIHQLLAYNPPASPAEVSRRLDVTLSQEGR